MAIKVTVKNSQSDFENTGFLAQGTFYVDDSHTTGLKSGFFCAIKGDGTSKCLSYGAEDQATLTYAGAREKEYASETDRNGNTWAGATIPAHKADGMLYKQTARDRYGRSDDLNDEERYFPYGKREDLAIGMLKKGVLEVCDTDTIKTRYFTTVNKAVGTATFSVDTFTLAGHGMKVGDKVDIAGSTYHITEVPTVDTFKAGDAGTAGDVKLLSQIGDPVYLATDMSGDLPFTTIKPTTAGDINQLIGYIESTMAVRIDLTLDLDPATVS